MPADRNEAGADVGSDSRSEDELDLLADNADKATNRERAMTETPEATAKPASKEEEAWEFEHSGKKVKGTREQILKWAQMGYDRPQFMQKFNQEKTKFDQDRQGWEKQWGVYRQIDDFANQNKDWWNFVQQQWQSRGTFNPATAQAGTQPGQPGSQPQAQPANGQAGDPYQTILQQVEERLAQKMAPIEQFATEWQQEKSLAKQKQEDDALAQEVQSIREQYKDLDWDALDEDGKHLELRILEHAQANGIPTFRAALRDLLHDDLLSRAEAQAKVAVSRGIQAKSKLGVLGETPTPQKGWSPQRTKSIKNTSYEELQAEIFEELRRNKG